ncbi:hypothetical protein A3F05_02950 [Candidatus Saccharibacteria bacterium RIFCSPHIGHO2_12_FULL_47_17]|nr:MAG: hypothetical protein A3F05_02950 [Candidatus Saccharibacteria bacterium RIFCSPHIGHO2_12_FULL_47_17]
MLRYSLIFGNALLLVGVAAFVITNRSTSQTIRSGTLASFSSSTSSKAATLDQLSSAQIALTAAKMTRLAESTAVRNQADSDNILLNIVPSDSVSVSKPLIVAGAQKSKYDIVEYTASAGDTVPSIANKFGLTADSVRWSNSFSGNVVAAGTKLVIPPINGIVYTVKAGDTPAGLASRFRADENQIITFNDAEINGLVADEKIIIPNGQQFVPAVRTNLISSFTANYGSNGYDYGYCTYYVAAQIAVPTNWGNANTWDQYARLSGWTVSRTPRPGAIGQSNGGWLGHVGVVNEVSADGTMIKYSDMNGLAGWGRVGRSDWTPISRFDNYIYR